MKHFLAAMMATGFLTFVPAALADTAPQMSYAAPDGAGVASFPCANDLNMSYYRNQPLGGWGLAQGVVAHTRCGLAGVGIVQYAWVNNLDGVTASGTSNLDTFSGWYTGLGRGPFYFHAGADITLPFRWHWTLPASGCYAASTRVLKCRQTVVF